MSRMTGKIAIVTGGSSGIGKATVDLFVQEGAKVVAIDLNAPVEPEQPFAAGVEFVQGSVTDPICWTRAYASAQAAFGGVPNVLVQSAGVPGRQKLTDTTRETWDRVMEINVTAVFEGASCEKRWLMGAGMKLFINTLDGLPGSIVNISSIAGVTAMRAGAAYEASKAACSHMSKSAAAEYADRGIRVNCVAPGLTVTGMTRNSTRSAASVESFFAHTPMRRWGTAEEVAKAVLYFSSDEASYVTGIVFCHDGGYTAT